MVEVKKAHESLPADADEGDDVGEDQVDLPRCGKG